MAETPQCGAETRKGHPCRQPAGWGTDHPGEGRCKHHGGAGGGEPGNKNAVTTGEHESIFYDQLEDEEQRLWHEVDTDALAQVDEQIRTHNIRIRRMLGRIRQIKEEEMSLVSRETEAGNAGEGVIDITRETFEDAIERIQRVEEALTRVQKELRKLVREKYRILKDQPADNSEKLDELLSRMRSMRGDAPDYEPPKME
jgi:uncharacterized protein YjcR